MTNQVGVLRRGTNQKGVTVGIGVVDGERDGSHQLAVWIDNCQPAIPGFRHKRGTVFQALDGMNFDPLLVFRYFFGFVAPEHFSCGIDFSDTVPGNRQENPVGGQQCEVMDFGIEWELPGDFACAICQGHLAPVGAKHQLITIFKLEQRCGGKPWEVPSQKTA